MNYFSGSFYVKRLWPGVNLSTVAGNMNPLQFYRMLVILNGTVPLLMLIWDAYRGQLGANSVNYALHVTGILSLVFLFLSLLMTPLRWATRWGGWIAFRRALGLYGFFYSVVHVAIYIGLDRALNFSSTWHEIWMRRFLQIGTAAILLMVPLAVTSTNSMIQRIGSRRWKSLHRAAYLVAILGVVHYYMLVKSDVRQPLAFAGVLAVLLGGRFVHHYLELLQASRTNTRISQTELHGMTRSMIPERAAEDGKPRQRWTGELKVAAIFQETPDVKTYRLTAPRDDAFPFAYLPGQFLNLQLIIDGKRVNRSYTIASSPTRADYCELSIKREPHGLASRYIHDQIKPGDVLKVSGPSGRFTFTGQDGQSVLLISGGVGITPLMSIVRYLTDRVWSGDIYFLIVAKTERDLIFYDEIRWLERRFSRLHVCRTLTRCDPEDMWNGDRGRATEVLVRRFVPELTRLPVYLCGPNEMMDATKDLLLGIGVAASQIRTEAFASRTAEALSMEEIGARTIVDLMSKEPLKTSGARVPLTATATISFARAMVKTEVSSETSVLEAAEALSIALPYECRSGICGQCKTRLIEGEVGMQCEDALSVSEKANGWILACQAHPRSDLIVDA